MKLDQIAMYAASESQKHDIKAWFGLVDKKWITDTVTCVSDVWMNDKACRDQNVAELNFNYDLGTEFEILRFVSGPHWHENLPRPWQRPFISHIGIHLDDGDPWPWQNALVLKDSDAVEPTVGNMVRGFGKLVQRTKTIKHTADHFNRPESPAYGRTYQYEIYEIGTGAFIKYIRRINAKSAIG